MRNQRYERLNFRKSANMSSPLQGEVSRPKSGRRGFVRIFCMPEGLGYNPESEGSLRYGTLGGVGLFKGRVVRQESMQKPGFVADESVIDTDTGASETAKKSDSDAAKDIEYELGHERVTKEIIDMINTALRQEHLPPDAVRIIRQNAEENRKGGDNWQINANQYDLGKGLVFVIKPGYENKVREIMSGPIPGRGPLEGDRRFHDKKWFDFVEALDDGFTLTHKGSDGLPVELRFLYVDKQKKAPRAANDNEPRIAEAA